MSYLSDEIFFSICKDKYLTINTMIFLPSHVIIFVVKNTRAQILVNVVLQDTII